MQGCQPQGACTTCQPNASVQQHKDAGVGLRVVPLVGRPGTGAAVSGTDVHDYGGGESDDLGRYSTCDRSPCSGPSNTILRYANICKVWICRWRHFFSIVPKAITCSYKVSYAKKMVRLGVLWRNATRLLVFHELLFGPDKLTFVSMDEKPYRFNACGGDKVWAHRGQKAVKCKEVRGLLLKRWTGITAVFSRPIPAACLPDGTWQPRWTALFKTKGDDQY